jgi:hypothetical protein
MAFRNEYNVILVSRSPKEIAMEHELIDRAEAIQQRVLQLRDSL